MIFLTNLYENSPILIARVVYCGSRESSMERVKFTKSVLTKLGASRLIARYGDSGIKELFFEVSSCGDQKFKLIKKFDGRKLIVSLGDFPYNRSQLGHVVEKNGQGSFWQRVTMRVGLYSSDKASRLTFHDLRRSTATRMVRAGIELAVIQKALGHSSLAITQRTYAHHYLSQVRASLEHIQSQPPADLEQLKAQLEALTPEQRKALLGGL